jgi:putative transposase
VEYRTSAHAICDVKYHVVWVTKYRYKILRGRIAERARDLLRQICQSRDVVVIRGAVSPDHIHMLVSAPPHSVPGKLVQYLKGKSSRRLQEEFPDLRKRYWGQHLWVADTSARQWVRSRRTRSNSTLRGNNGTKTIKGSRSPHPRSLEPALLPGILQAGLSRTPTFSRNQTHRL